MTIAVINNAPPLPVYTNLLTFIKPFFIFVEQPAFSFFQSVPYSMH